MIYQQKTTENITKCDRRGRENIQKIWHSC